MSTYHVEFSKSAFKEFKKLPKKIQDKVIEGVQFLSQNPFSEFLKVKKIKGEDNLYRLRIGDYRIVFEIQNKRLIIVVIAIGHRKDIYRKI